MNLKTYWKNKEERRRIQLDFDLKFNYLVVEEILRLPEFIDIFIKQIKYKIPLNFFYLLFLIGFSFRIILWDDLYFFFI